MGVWCRPQSETAMRNQARAFRQSEGTIKKEIYFLSASLFLLTTGGLISVRPSFLARLDPICCGTGRCPIRIRICVAEDRQYGPCYLCEPVPSCQVSAATYCGLWKRYLPSLCMERCSTQMGHWILEKGCLLIPRRMMTQSCVLLSCRRCTSCCLEQMSLLARERTSSRPCCCKGRQRWECSPV